jgi:hypothetical protein
LRQWISKPDRLLIVDDQGLLSPVYETLAGQSFEITTAGRMSPDYPVESVCLVGFPKDGNDLYILTHVEPYDEKVALEALDWLGKVTEMGAAPKPERLAQKFCRYYCGYWDPTGVIGCTGR